MFLRENVIQIAQKNWEHSSFLRWGHPALKCVKAGPHFIEKPHYSEILVSTQAVLKITFVLFWRLATKFPVTVDLELAHSI